MSWYGGDYGDYYDRPKRIAGNGIKSRNRGGSFGATWWGRRWTEVLHELGMGERLYRGQTYARVGQVLNIDVVAGSIKGRVQGSRRTPYKVEVKLSVCTEAQRQALVKALSEQPLLAAQLLAGQMPSELETLCREARFPLFPARAEDLRTDCACPDWANPCKHVAAVYCLLAEAIDDNPFLLFTLRGVERDSLAEQVLGTTPGLAPIAPEPLPVEPELFWQGSPVPPISADWRLPATPAALPKQLGPLPFWRGDESLAQRLEPLYAKATEHVAERV